MISSPPLQLANQRGRGLGDKANARSSGRIDLAPLSLGITGSPSNGSLSRAANDRVLDALIFELFSVWDMRGTRNIPKADFHLVRSIVIKLTSHMAQAGSTAEAGRRPLTSGGDRRRSSSVPGRRAARPSSPAPRRGPQHDGADLPQRGVLFTPPRSPEPFVRSPSKAARSPSASARSPSKTESRRSLEQPAPNQSGTRVPFFEGLRRSAFTDVDLDGDGQVDDNEFRTWIQGALDASQLNRAARHHWVGWLVQHLGSATRVEPRIVAFRILIKDSQTAANLEQQGELAKAVDTMARAMIKAESAFGDGDNEILAPLQAQLVAFKEAYRTRVIGALENASLFAALDDALEEAAAAAPLLQLQDNEIQPYRDKMDLWSQPIPIHVSTVAGSEATTEAYRTETVDDLKERLAPELGEKAYRVMLSNDKLRLEPDTATLEELGVCSPEGEELVAAFGAKERWKEMSVEDFVELAVSLHAMTREQGESIRTSIEKGEMKVDEMLSRYVRAVEWEENAAVRRKEAEARAEEQRKARIAAEKAAEERRRQKELEREQKIRAEIEAELPALQELAESVKDEQLVEKLNSLGFSANLDDLSSECRQLVAELVAHDRISQLLADMEQTQDAKLQKNQDDMARLQETVNLVLHTALPALDECFKSVARLSRRDIAEAKASAAKPLPGMIKVAESLCIMFRVKPMKVVDPEGRKVDSYWRPAMRLALDPGPRFLDKLFEYDKDNIPDGVITAIQPYIDDPDFNVDNMRKLGPFWGAACGWVRAMHTYHDGVQSIGPARNELFRIEFEYAWLFLRRAVLQGRHELTKQCAASCLGNLNTALQKFDGASVESGT